MAITITTTSSLNRDYLLDRANAIYPVFVDNMPYEAWKQNWNGDYNIPAPTINGSRTEYFQLLATGGTTYAWSIVSGSLPDGLQLSTDGRISGTATREGDYHFTVKAVSGSLEATKALSLTAHPFRAKWHSEARAGFWFSIGFTMYPQVEISVAGIADLEARFNQNFDATEWVSQIKSLGFRYITFNAFTGDSLKTWPSTSVYEGKRNFKTTTDYIRLLADACHAQGLHLTVYVAVDSFSTWPVYQSTDPTKPYYSTDPAKFCDATLQIGNQISPLPDDGKEQPNADPVFLYKWGQRNTALIRELSLMEYLDGYWFDVGAADPAFFQVSADLARWNSLWPLIRSNNPFQIVGINSGSFNYQLGNLWQYPHIDYTIFEGTAADRCVNSYDAAVPFSRAITLKNGVPTAARKKMSIEGTNTLDIYWIRNRENQVPGTHLRSLEALTNAIQRNWDAGATCNLAVCVQADGTLLYPAYEDRLEELSFFLNANNNPSEAPRLELSGSTLTMSTQTVSRIHYTLDNSKPTAESPIYSQPIALTQSTIARAISISAGKSPSIETQVIYKTQSQAGIPPLTRLFESVANDVTQLQTSQYYRGMLFVVGQNALELYQVGRKNTGNTSNKRIVIKQFADNRTLLFDTFDMTVAVAADGYQYSNVVKTVLQAGMTYYIAIQENTVDNYASNAFSQIPVSGFVRITGRKILNSNSDVAPVTDDGLGQFLNLKYKVLPPQKDLARGKPVNFKRSVPPFTILPANAPLVYSLDAFNVNDGDLNTSAQASAPDYKSMIEINLQTVRKISKVVLRFFNNNWTSISLGVGLVENEFNLLEVKTDNYEDHMVFEFNPVYAQYVYARMLVPDGPNQAGSGSMTSAFEIYSS